MRTELLLKIISFQIAIPKSKIEFTRVRRLCEAQILRCR